MRVGVTGATGFLGSHVARRLVEGGHDVVGLRRRTSSTTVLDGVELEWRLGDLREPEAADRLVEGCELVVHAAAVISSWSGHASDHQGVNVEGTQHLVEACRRSGVRRLVHVSSVAAVALGAGGAPADESAPFGAEAEDLSYNASKRRAEDAVAAGVQRGLDAVIVNPGSLHGPNGAEFRGAALIEGVRRRKVVPYFAGGTSIAHVDDVATGVLLALERGQTGERYILAGENHSWRELAEIASETLGVERVFVRVPRAATAGAAAVGELMSARTGRRPRFTREVHVNATRSLYYDSGKAVRELGYAFRPYREIVAEYVTTWRRG